MNSLELLRRLAASLDGSLRTEIKPLAERDIWRPKTKPAPAPKYLRDGLLPDRAINKPERDRK